MGLLFLILQIVALVFAGLFLVLKCVAYKHKKYFERIGVPYLEANFYVLVQMIWGKISLPEVFQAMYKEALEKKTPYVGYSDGFINPSLFITDLDLMRNIYVKDFDHFADRRKFTTQKGDLLFQRMLFMMDGEKWKGMRAKLSPTFTTGKIRRMFSIFDKCSGKMCEYLKRRVGPSGGDFDITEINSKYAMEVIASCVFGVDSNSFESKPGKLSEFEEMGQLLRINFKTKQFFKIMFIIAAPKLADMMGLEATDPLPQCYFQGVVQQVLEHRRETGERQDDFLQLMMDVQKGLLKDNEEGESRKLDYGESNKVKLDDDDIAANCVLFLIAGFHTLQSILIYTPYALALEQEVQQKLLEEIRTTEESRGGKLTYDALHEMKYLDMVINETLRCYPPSMQIERLCTKDYKIPETDVVIRKGLLVSMPVIGLHRDPKYYENPEKFDPERFLPERKSERHPYAFAPFGHGPRNCIGMRFALTEVKTAIYALVKNFKLEPCSRTEIPPRHGNNVTLKPRDGHGMWLKVQPRSEG